MYIINYSYIYILGLVRDSYRRLHRYNPLHLISFAQCYPQETPRRPAPLIPFAIVCPLQRRVTAVNQQASTGVIEGGHVIMT